MYISIGEKKRWIKIKTKQNTTLTFSFDIFWFIITEHDVLSYISIMYNASVRYLGWYNKNYIHMLNYVCMPSSHGRNICMLWCYIRIFLYKYICTSTIEKFIYGFHSIRKRKYGYVRDDPRYRHIIYGK